jgi:hypothetical protein
MLPQVLLKTFFGTLFAIQYVDAPYRAYAESTRADYRAEINSNSEEKDIRTPLLMNAVIHDRKCALYARAC